MNYFNRIYKLIERKIRSVWHDFYYSVSGDHGADFAMTCEEASKYTDLGLSKAGVKQKMRYKLHMSICQVCDNYDEFMAILKNKIKRIQKNQKRKFSDHEIEEMNKNLFNHLTMKK